MFSARTYQVLYCLRTLAETHNTTDGFIPEDVARLIQDRRRLSPAAYTQAYISPTDLTALMRRMASDGLLTTGIGSPDVPYTLDIRGAQIADLLQNLDACSDGFLENYKSKVVEAALLQTQRLGKNNAQAKELAEVTGMSAQSVRQGLGDLISAGIVQEETKGRTSTYRIKPTNSTPAPQTPTNVDEVKDLLQGLDNEPEIPEVKANPEGDPLGINQGVFEGLRELKTPTPEEPAKWTPRQNPATQSDPLDAAKQIMVDLFTNLGILKPSDRINKPSDNGPTESKVEEGKCLPQETKGAEKPEKSDWVIQEERMWAELMAGLDSQSEGTKPSDNDPIESGVKADMPPLQETKPEESEWDAIPMKTRKRLMAQAEACGITLRLYLQELASSQESRIKRALRLDDERLIRQSLYHTLRNYKS